MEQTRSFGYICPKCGKAVLGSRTKFALSATAVHISCDCGDEGLEIQTDGRIFRLWVPCGVCGDVHQAEVSCDAVLEGRGIGLACPQTHQLCCYVGQEHEVRHNIEELAIRREKDKCEEPQAFTDNVIMYEVLSELKDIAARKGISCTCGSHDYRMEIQRDAVDLICDHCGGRLRVNAGTDEDLDLLCCQYSLRMGNKMAEMKEEEI